MQNKIVTICACTSRSFITKDKVARLAAVLKNEGYSVRIEADLCKKVLQGMPDMQAITSGSILACNSRAIRAHFHWLGQQVDQSIDIRNENEEEVLSHFRLAYSEERDEMEKEAFRRLIEEMPVEYGTDAWYPVIDKQKCTDCGRCHDFCLFGVYTIENKRVRVVQPQNCKNNCPACARMCPSKAIIFPKYEKSPINGGTIEEEVFNPEEMDKLYREKLRIKLQQRRASVSLLKTNNK